MKPVLILTAGFGEGHNAAARNLRDALRTAHPEARVEMEDVFATAYGPLNAIATRAYLQLINKAPDLWSVIFQWLHETAAMPQHIGVLGRAARVLSRILVEVQPGVIISTYPGNNLLLDYIFRDRPERPVQVTVVTDSITINAVWHSGHSDWFLVPNDATAEVMRAQGVDPAKIRVTGFPTPGIFSELGQPKAPPEPGEKWKVLFMVNSGKTIAVETARLLAAIEGIALTVTVGRDDELMTRIRTATRTAASEVRFFGWTDQMPHLLAESHIVVTKAGGATVQEALAAQTPLIVSQVVPGQEEGNAQLVLRAGAGTLAESPDSIASVVRAATAEGGAEWARWYHAIQPLSRPDAAAEIAEWVASFSRENVKLAKERNAT